MVGVSIYASSSRGILLPFFLAHIAWNSSPDAEYSLHDCNTNNVSKHFLGSPHFHPGPAFRAPGIH